MAYLLNQCQDCDVLLSTPFDFIEHQNIHSGETPFKCRFCDKCHSLLLEYVNHVKIKHAQDYQSGVGVTETNESLIGCVATTADLYKININQNSFAKKNRCNCSKLGKWMNATTKATDEKVNKKFGNGKSIPTARRKRDTIKYNTHCDICNKDFTSVKNLDIHQKEVHNFPCQKCFKMFSTSQKLLNHTCNFRNNERELKCSCLQKFSTFEKFKLHIGSKPFSCCECLMKFNNITNLIRHIRTHTKQKPYVCKDCGRAFSQSTNLKNHASVHLGISAVKCSDCNFSCKTHSGLLKHRKKHMEGNLNLESVMDRRQMSSDISTCPICKKEFLFKRNMGMHMKIHNSKPLLCTECGKIFHLKGKLTSHYKACHKEPSICKICNKVFGSAVLLSSHEKIHVNKKLYSCTTCQKSFTVKNYLFQHMKTHSDKKHFSCNKCGKLFKVAVSLKYHNNICTNAQKLHPSWEIASNVKSEQQTLCYN